MTDRQEWLVNSLQARSVDIYAPPGPFDSLRDRLGQAIVDNGFGPVIAGRHNGKPESYADLFERIYGTKLPKAPR